MKIWRILLLIIIFSTGPATAGTIYTWTDTDGIQRFGDKPPASGIEYRKIETPSSPSDSPEPSAEISDNRRAYDQMIKEIRQESKQYELDRERKAREENERQREAKATAHKNQIQEKKQKLLEKIDALNNRALSPNFTQGMRQAQVDALKKEMQGLGTADQQKK